MTNGEAAVSRPRRPAIVLQFPVRPRPQPPQWWRRWLRRLRYGKTQ